MQEQGRTSSDEPALSEHLSYEGGEVDAQGRGCHQASSCESQPNGSFEWERHSQSDGQAQHIILEECWWHPDPVHPHEWPCDTAKRQVPWLALLQTS